VREFAVHPDKDVSVGVNGARANEGRKRKMLGLIFSLSYAYPAQTALEGRK
jgi:hypothetical protein